MLEKETELIVQILTERTIGTRDGATLREALEADIPRGVKTYIQAEVGQLLQQGFRDTPQYDRLGGAGPASRRIVRGLTRSMALEYFFPREEFLATLDNAVHFVENYLCRPHWTLEHFVFEQAPRVDLETLHEKLEYLSDYSYLGSILERSVRSKQWNGIDVEQFRSLLLKIDEQVVRQHNARETALLARPIYNFLLLGETSPDHAIPLKPLLVFYDDKHMSILKEYIERVCQIRSRTELSLNELAGIIADLYLGIPRKDEPAAPEETSEPQALNALHAESPVAVDGSEMSGPVNEQANEQREMKGDTANPRAAADEPLTREPQPAGVSHLPNRGMNSAALSLTFAGIVETQPFPPLPDLEHVISQEQKADFVKRVFKKDDAYYAGVIAAMNRIRTWQEASAYLQELFQMNGLDPYTDEVIAFTDAIQQRYMSGKATTE